MLRNGRIAGTQNLSFVDDSPASTLDFHRLMECVSPSNLRLCPSGPGDNQSQHSVYPIMTVRR